MPDAVSLESAVNGAAIAGHNRVPVFTEEGVARDFAAEHQNRLVYDHTDEKWFVWDGSRWRADETRQAVELVRAFVEERSRSTLADDKDKRAMGRYSFTSAVAAFARSDRRLAVHHAVWDRDPWLLGVPGGVVDLRSGGMRDAKPQDYIRRQAKAAPAAPGTTAPHWFAFLDQATRGDRDLQAFLQRLLGMCLTGDVSEEVLCFLYGSGGNGKGVFLGAATAILADYAVAMPIEAFTRGARTVPLEYYRAQMAGARLVTASETEAGSAWSEAQIKELTGNEAPVSARHPYGQPFTYLPQFKLLIVGNHAPQMKGRSPAMERRMRIVPFPHKPAKPDPDLKDKIAAEYPAILRWMIEGCLMWQKHRLGTARAVQAATSNYFESQDAFGRWLTERCILAAHLRTKNAAAFADYREWCAENGETPAAVREFGELIERTDTLTRGPVNGHLHVKGLGLQPSTHSRSFHDDR